MYPVDSKAGLPKKMNIDPSGRSLNVPQFGLWRKPPPPHFPGHKLQNPEFEITPQTPTPATYPPRQYPPNYLPERVVGEGVHPAHWPHTEFQMGGGSPSVSPTYYPSPGQPTGFVNQIRRVEEMRPVYPRTLPPPTYRATYQPSLPQPSVARSYQVFPDFSPMVQFFQQRNEEFNQRKAELEEHVSGLLEAQKQNFQKSFQQQNYRFLGLFNQQKDQLDNHEQRIQQNEGLLDSLDNAFRGLNREFAKFKNSISQTCSTLSSQFELFKARLDELSIGQSQLDQRLGAQEQRIDELERKIQENQDKISPQVLFVEPQKVGDPTPPQPPASAPLVANSLLDTAPRPLDWVVETTTPAPAPLSQENKTVLFSKSKEKKEEGETEIAENNKQTSSIALAHDEKKFKDFCEFVDQNNHSEVLEIINQGDFTTFKEFQRKVTDASSTTPSNQKISELNLSADGKSELYSALYTNFAFKLIKSNITIPADQLGRKLKDDLGDFALFSSNKIRTESSSMRHDQCLFFSSDDKLDTLKSQFEKDEFKEHFPEHSSLKIVKESINFAVSVNGFPSQSRTLCFSCSENGFIFLKDKSQGTLDKNIKIYEKGGNYTIDRSTFLSLSWWNRGLSEAFIFSTLKLNLDTILAKTAKESLPTPLGDQPQLPTTSGGPPLYTTVTASQQTATSNGAGVEHGVGGTQSGRA